MALCTTGECSRSLGSFSAEAQSEVFLGSKDGLVGFSSVLAFTWQGFSSWEGGGVWGAGEWGAQG